MSSNSVHFSRAYKKNVTAILNSCYHVCTHCSLLLFEMQWNENYLNSIRLKGVGRDEKVIRENRSEKKTETVINLTKCEAHELNEMRWDENRLMVSIKITYFYFHDCAYA